MESLRLRQWRWCYGSLNVYAFFYFQYNYIGHHLKCFPVDSNHQWHYHKLHCHGNALLKSALPNFFRFYKKWHFSRSSSIHIGSFRSLLRYRKHLTVVSILTSTCLIFETKEFTLLLKLSNPFAHSHSKNTGLETHEKVLLHVFHHVFLSACALLSVQGTWENQI